MDRCPREREILMKRRKRFAIVIGVAAAGVMALGAQTAAAPTYNTRLTITEARGHLIYGLVYSGGGKKCEVGRRVTLFKQQPGADRKIIDVRSGAAGPKRGPAGTWGLGVPQGSLPVKAGWRVYAKATPKVGDGFVCRGDRSPIEVVGLRE
jgi:hypothetical protein